MQRRTKQSVAAVSGSINGQRQRKGSSGDQLKIDGRTTTMVFSITPMVSEGGGVPAEQRSTYGDGGEAVAVVQRDFSSTVVASGGLSSVGL
nr:hypothetical protein Itr_chr01CG06020 [Ipomoea trifida]GLL16855.1 hypothetical protein Itr_chr01CG06030 [Ipomoea trifida]